MAIPIPPGPEPINPTPRPRADKSGGLLTVAVGNGSRTHRMHFHLLPFNAASRVSHTEGGISLGPLTFGGITVPNDLPYLDPAVKTDDAQAAEAFVGVTIHNIQQILSLFFTDDFIVQATRLQRMVTDPNFGPDHDPVAALTGDHPYAGVLIDVLPLPFVLPTAGQNTNPILSPSSMTVFNFQAPSPDVFDDAGRVVRAGRGSVRIQQSPEWEADGEDLNVVGSWADGASTGERLVGYFGKATNATVATAVIAHNGQPFVNQAHVTNTFYKYYRRSKFNRAA